MAEVIEPDPVRLEELAQRHRNQVCVATFGLTHQVGEELLGQLVLDPRKHSGVFGGEAAVAAVLGPPVDVRVVELGGTHRHVLRQPAARTA